MSAHGSGGSLVDAAMSGDGSAFAELIRPEYPIAYRFAYWMLRDSSAAEDAVQEAAFKAWRKLGTFRRGSQLRPWFLAIVANECRTAQRSNWMSRVQSGSVDGTVEDADMATTLDLHRGLTRLRHEERLILVLRYYLDMPFDEIAGMLGITQKAARLRVERAVNRLRPMLRMQEVMG